MRFSIAALLCLAGLALASADAAHQSSSKHSPNAKPKTSLKPPAIVPGSLHVRTPTAPKPKPAAKPKPAVKPKPTVAMNKPKPAVQPKPLTAPKPVAAKPKPQEAPKPVAAKPKPQEASVKQPDFKVAQKVHKMGVFVDGHGARVNVRRHAADSAAARRLLKARTDQYPDGKPDRTQGVVSPDPLINGDTNSGVENDFLDVRRGSLELRDTVEVTFRIPHDGDPTTRSQILTLHGWARDNDTWVSTQASPNDPYAPSFHDPYSGTAGGDSRDGPRAGNQNEGPGTESFFAAWNAESAATNPRGKHDALKITWSCSNGASSPAVAPSNTMAHAQGYRKSTGQRTSGHEPFYADERFSCSTEPDVTGFKPRCLVHAYDSPPPKTWGAHALQDGPSITTVFQYQTPQDWPANTVADQDSVQTCTMTATDPYGQTDTLVVSIKVLKELNHPPVSSWKSGGVVNYTVPHDHSPETHHVQVLLDGEYMDPDNLDQNFGPLGNTAVETTSMGIQKQLHWQLADMARKSDGLDGVFVGDAPAKRFVGTGYCQEGTYSSMRNYHTSSLIKCQDDCADWGECHTLWYNGTNCRLFNNCINNDPSYIDAVGEGARYTKEVNMGTSWAMFRGRPRGSFHGYDHAHGHGNDTVTFLWTCPTADGEYFEQTLGHCREGSDAASAYQGTGKSAFCRKDGDIQGDIYDYCESMCLSTQGCQGYQVSDVAYQGTCQVASCLADKCELMMQTPNGTTQDPDHACPSGFTDHQSTTYNGAVADHNNMHGNGDRNAQCFTRKPGQAFDMLKPVVSLAGPAHEPAFNWTEPGGQKGELPGNDQWDSEFRNHVCTLRVTDSYEASHTTAVTIRVSREPNNPPVADAGPDQEYTVPHDFNPDTTQVLVTLHGYNTTDADRDKMKYVWKCTANGVQTALATVELPFPVQLGGINTGYEEYKGAVQTGAADPNYVPSESPVQTSDGWGQDSGHSGDGDTFKGTHTHQRNQVGVMLEAGTHACVLTATDTYNQATEDTVMVVVNPEPDAAPNA